MTAKELHTAMFAAIRAWNYPRAVADAASPTRDETVEAAPGSTFVMRNADRNCVTCDRRWAAANVLHFFSGSEEAGVLRQYCKHADRFLSGDRWVGAYGAIAVPQLRACIAKLRSSMCTRRAVISMGGLEHDDINRPACWSFLHLLVNRSGLNLLVYQRSLSMSVFPYDCILLTNILHFAAAALHVPAGALHWTVGSLHVKIADLQREAPGSDSPLFLPHAVLADSEECINSLLGGRVFEHARGA
jgi:hypothetical protein